MAPVNKVHHVHTVTRVAEMLGENEDWLCDVATEMDQEDGLIWVFMAYFARAGSPSARPLAQAAMSA